MYYMHIYASVNLPFWRNFKYFISPTNCKKKDWVLILKWYSLWTKNINSRDYLYLYTLCIVIVCHIILILMFLLCTCILTLSDRTVQARKKIQQHNEHSRSRVCYYTVASMLPLQFLLENLDVGCAVLAEKNTRLYFQLLLENYITIKWWKLQCLVMNALMTMKM